MQKPKFILCPRCELNYFSTEDKKRKHCDVCLAELNLVDPSILIPDEDAELEVVCPVCKINYMSPDEEMCFLCAKENADKIEKDEESLDSWDSYIEAEEPLDDDIDMSLSELEAEDDEDDPFDDPHDTIGDGFETVDPDEEWIDIDEEIDDDEEEDDDWD